MTTLRNAAPWSIVALAGVLICIGPTLAQERRTIPDYREYGEPTSDSAVRSLVRDFKDAWMRQDADAFIALHSEDTEWINAYARMFQDAQSLSLFIEQRLFPAFDSAVSRQEVENMRVISIRYLGDSAAVVHMYTDGARGSSRNEEERLRRTHIHLVLEAQQSGWKIVHTAIMDAR